MSTRRARRWRRCHTWLLHAVALASWVGSSACDSRRPLESRGAPPASFGLSRPPPATSRRGPADADAGRTRQSARAHEPRSEAAAAASNSLDASDVAGSVGGPFIIDALVDVAPAGPIAATERGVAMFDRDNHLLLAPLGAPLGTRKEPGQSPIVPLSETAGPFPLARGPAVRRGLAYWVSRGRLLGQSLASAGSGSPLVLGEDARVGTRAAVPVGASRNLQGLPQIAAYIARPKAPDGPPIAKLWIEGHLQGLGLTDDLASSHSVALAATPKGLNAVFLEARTGISSIHVRPISFSARHEPTLGEDRIVWVGGPAQPSTELFVLPSDEPRVRGFLTLERDVTHFGLVGLDIPLAADAELPVEPEWLVYPNGIQPAPVALARLCGRPIVALARPSTAVPHAPQELVLLDLERTAAPQPVLIARSRAFFDISLVGLDGGALLAYVADHRTWARTIRCARR